MTRRNTSFRKSTYLSRSGTCFSHGIFPAERSRARRMQEWLPGMAVGEAMHHVCMLRMAQRRIALACQSGR
nr:MAG TPA: hypothetical protein [Caudoviricetes sp.]